MTIEEYLNSEVESTQKTVDTVGPFDAKTEAYYRGRRDAYRELLEKFPEMEHDVTLREAKDFCQKQLDDCEDDEDPCEYCPMATECSDSDDCRWMECGEIADFLPRDWNVDEIQKRIKEEGNARRSNSTVKSYTENS